METLTKTPKVVSSTEGTKFNIMGHEVTVKLHSTFVSCLNPGASSRIDDRRNVGRMHAENDRRK